MFRLYHNEKECELRIEPVGNLSLKESINYDNIIYYNNNYYICNDREKLKYHADMLLEEWKEKASDRLNKVIQTKVKNRYK
ncbi:MAG: hypothetical protein ACRC1P_09675 [Cellulosilyticaceae bacterium]